MMLPGFVDCARAHQHDRELPLLGAALRPAERVARIVAAVADFAAAHADIDVIRGQGWSNTACPASDRSPDLDAVVSDRPVVIRSDGYHSSGSTPRRSTLAGITGKTPDPRTASSSASPAPSATDTAVRRCRRAACARRPPTSWTPIVPDYTVQQYKDGLLYFQQEVAGPLGITARLRSAAVRGRQRRAGATRSWRRAGELTVRVRAALSLVPRRRRSRPWLAAAKAERAKHTPTCSRRRPSRSSPTASSRATPAYLLEPYADALGLQGRRDYRRSGSRPRSTKAFAEGSTRPASRSTRTPSATRPPARRWTRSRTRARVNGARDWRPGITHLQLVDARPTSSASRRLGVTAVPHPYWFLKDDYYTYLQLPYLGLPRADVGVPDEELLRRRRDSSRRRATSRSRSRRTRSMGIAVGVMRWVPGLVWVGTPDPRRRALAGGARDHPADDPQLHDQRRQGQLPREARPARSRSARAPTSSCSKRNILTCDPDVIGRPTSVLLTMFRGEIVFDAGAL